MQRLAKIFIAIAVLITFSQIPPRLQSPMKETTVSSTVLISVAMLAFAGAAAVLLISEDSRLAELRSFYLKLSMASTLVALSILGYALLLEGFKRVPPEFQSWLNVKAAGSVFI